jgi:hypothetical protein
MDHLLGQRARAVHGLACGARAAQCHDPVAAGGGERGHLVGHMQVRAGVDVGRLTREHGDLGQDALRIVADHGVHHAVLDIGVRVTLVGFGGGRGTAGIAVGVHGPLGVLHHLHAGAVARIFPGRQRLHDKLVSGVGEVIEEACRRRGRIGQRRDGHRGPGEHHRRIHRSLLGERRLGGGIGLHVRAAGPALSVDDQAAVLGDDLGLGDDGEGRERGGVHPGITRVVVVTHGVGQHDIRVCLADRAREGAEPVHGFDRDRHAGGHSGDLDGLHRGRVEIEPAPGIRRGREEVGWRLVGRAVVA